MERYIDANALYQKLETYKDNVLKEFGPGRDVDCFNFFLEEIEAQPTADVAPVAHAHWEDCTESELDFFGSPVIAPKKRCSRCKKTNKRYTPPYCPHCGALMDKEARHG